jgi:quinol monooxygenase YgiN
MLLVAGTLTVGPEAHSRFLAAAAAVVSPTLAEAGCRQYGFWADSDRPGRFLVFESWESEAQLEAHLRTPHLKAFRRALAEMGLRESSLHRYPVDDVRPL